MIAFAGVVFRALAQVSNTYSSTMTAPSTMMPKSMAPRESSRRNTGIRRREGRQQRRGMITATMPAAEDCQEHVQTIVTRSAPFQKVLEHRVQRRGDQDGPV